MNSLASRREDKLGSIRAKRKRWHRNEAAIATLGLVRCVQLAGFVSDVILANTELTATLSFLSLFFLEKGRENHPKKQGFFMPTEPLKSLEKKGKTVKKTRKCPQGEKQGIPKKQGKEGQGINRLQVTNNSH